MNIEEKIRITNLCKPYKKKHISASTIITKYINKVIFLPYDSDLLPLKQFPYVLLTACHPFTNKTIKLVNKNKNSDYYFFLYGWLFSYK